VKRPALEHIIRAAADITSETEFVIIGSSAVLAQYPDAPEPMLRSNEADIYPLQAPEKAWDIEGSLGYGSQFHEIFGYFADGVAPETAQLPKGWESRALVLRNANTRGAAGICGPAPHRFLVRRRTGRIAAASASKRKRRLTGRRPGQYTAPPPRM
jgi:hypothetical protein